MPDGVDGDPSTTTGATAAEHRAAGPRAELPERQGRHAGPSPVGPGDEAGRHDDPDRPDGPGGPGRPSADGRADPSHRARPDEDGDRPGAAAGAAPTPGDTARVERLLPDVAPAPVVPGVGHDPASSTSVLGSSRTSASSDAEEGTAPAPTPGEHRDDDGTGPEVHGTADAGPVPLVEPGAQAERCTQCGALIHEDDIFCGECGAVVQSVARSFTGPIVPLAPSWQPAATAEQTAPAGPSRGPASPEGSITALDRSDDAGEAERRRLVDQAARRALEWPPPASSRDEAEDGAPSGDDRSGGSDGRPGDAGRHGADPVAAPAVPASVRPAPLVQPPVTGVPDAVRGALPDGSDHPHGADRPDDQGRRVDRPSPPLLPPVPPSVTTASWASPARPAGDDDDVDETRIVRRRPVGDEFTLQFSTGESVRVSGHGLLGRAPVAQPGESFEHLVRISDPGKSVSKTHLEFGQEAGHLWVSDRWSGNGTLVRPSDGPARRVQPGTRVRVERGTRVDIGEQFFLVG